jgi:hypothetical protein
MVDPGESWLPLAGSCPTEQKWHGEKGTFRNFQTQRNCGPRKILTVIGIRTTHCAKVARREECNHEGSSVEQRRGKNKAENKFTIGTQEGWMFGKRRQVDVEGSTGVKDPNTRQHRRLTNEKTAGLIFEKTFRLQIAK